MYVNYILNQVSFEDMKSWNNNWTFLNNQNKWFSRNAHTRFFKVFNSILYLASQKALFFFCTLRQWIFVFKIPRVLRIWGNSFTRYMLSTYTYTQYPDGGTIVNLVMGDGAGPGVGEVDWLTQIIRPFLKSTKITFRLSLHEFF